MIFCLKEKQQPILLCVNSLLWVAFVEQGLRQLQDAAAKGWLRLVAAGRGLGVNKFVV